MNVQDDGKARRAYIVVINLAILLIALLHAVEGAMGGAGLAPRIPAVEIGRVYWHTFQVFGLRENYQSSFKFRDASMRWLP